MRIFLSKLIMIGSALFVGMPAMATVLDDFNRPDSASLGPNWTQIAGTSSISGNKAQGSLLSAALLNGASGNKISFDIFDVGARTQYIAAVFGNGTSTDYFVKVQNNGDADTGFSNYGFYRGNNSGIGGIFGNLTAGFSSGHVDVEILNTFATLTITPTIGATQVYSFDYGSALNGNQIGLGFFGAAQADNFGDGGSAVPEPSTIGLLGLGLLGLLTLRRKSAE